MVVKAAEVAQEIGDGIAAATIGSSRDQPMDESGGEVSIVAPKVVPKPTAENKERQFNAMEIIRILAKHPVVQPYFADLMTVRDINGQTPFMCAVQHRAYTAAMTLWNAVEEIYSNYSSIFYFEF